jgi:hypothetical protein
MAALLLYQDSFSKACVKVLMQTFYQPLFSHSFPFTNSFPFSNSFPFLKLPTPKGPKPKPKAKNPNQSQSQRQKPRVKAKGKKPLFLAKGLL